jgi:hypothetical protein
MLESGVEKDWAGDTLHRFSIKIKTSDSVGCMDETWVVRHEHHFHPFFIHSTFCNNTDGQETKERRKDSKVIRGKELPNAKGNL